MTAHCLIRANPHEPKLFRMVIASLVLHLCILALFLRQPPEQPGETLRFSPAYSVDLVSAPADAGEAAGPAGEGGGSEAHTPLWGGPAELRSQIKGLQERRHPVLTISKEDADLEEEPLEPSGAGTGGRQTGEKGSGSASSSGPPGAAGTAPQGGTPSQLRLKAYYRAVWSRIQSAWVLPTYALTCGEKCEAVVIIAIRRDGSIADISFEKKSGSARFDQSVIRALKKADPLPPLPASVRGGMLEVGLNFNP